MQPPVGNITFLFTDIERSSQLWETHPQTMGRSLAQHDQLVRSAFEAHRGFVFKTVGDAFCVAFNSAFDGLRAAVEAQRRLAAAAWEETGPLRVRMALHSGEAEQRDNDYFGPTLNRVARILSAAHGGQTLLSRVSAELIWDKLPAEISLRDLGERRLKDLSRPERIFQLVVQDLPADFPPLRSLEVLPNNLPAQVTSFVGRSREMAEVKRLLESSRLVTLTGAGGTGKTRLSLQVAAEVLDRFPQGVWLVELATLSTSEMVLATVADTLGIRIEQSRSPVIALADALRARNLLLVLDNCEHLVSACAHLSATLLGRCPKLKILASSREALNIPGEILHPVPPLAVAEWQILESREYEDLAQLEAVQLFAERASAVRSGFAVTAQNVETIARICSRVDGIPLAIELAAARMKVLSLDQILTRLDDRFRLLSGGSRTALPRQQTLGALIDWSYDLLSEPERTLLRRLAVFVAGRTVEMVEDICAGDGVERGQIFDLLSALVEKSLLVIEPGFQEETRYTMLESVWDYANEKLAERRETARYQRRHLEYFVKLAEEAEPALLGGAQGSWIEKLAFEHYNINAALDFAALDSATVELGLRLATGVERFWEIRGYLSEGYEHFRTLLAKAPADLPPLVKAKAELGAGILSWFQDRDKDSLRHYLVAKQIFESLGEREEVGVVEGMLGFTARNDGRPVDASAHFERARNTGVELGSDRVLARALSGMGSLSADRGEYALSRQLKEQSLAIVRRLGDAWNVGLITGSLARNYFAAGEIQSARRLFGEALASARAVGSRVAVPYLLEGLADIAVREGSAPKAVRLYGAASMLRESLALAFSATETITYNAALRELHRLVPDEQFEAEWQAGRALNLKGAIALALDDGGAPSGN